MNHLFHTVLKRQGTHVQHVGLLRKAHLRKCDLPYDMYHIKPYEANDYRKETFSMPCNVHKISVEIICFKIVIKYQAVHIDVTIELCFS